MPCWLAIYNAICERILTMCRRLSTGYMSSKSEIISTDNKNVMVNYMSGPDLGALPHRWGKAPSGSHTKISCTIPSILSTIIPILGPIHVCV